MSFVKNGICVLRAVLVSIVVAAAPTLAAAVQNSPVTPSPPEAHYRVYGSRGEQSSLREIFEALARTDVLLVGEMHNDPIAHLLEAELLRGTIQRFGQADKAHTRASALSLEMFERDVQVVLDEYLSGLITEKHFLLSSRPWNNYETDYRPLIELAREHQLATIAANAPARYVTRVARAGPDSLEALSPVAQNWLPPRPFAPASSAYADKFMQFLGGDTARPSNIDPSAARTVNPPPPHAFPPAHATTYLLDAQNLRDATMAYSIAEYLRRRPGAFVMHVNGRFHSEEKLGVAEHLRRYRPGARVVVVTIVADPDFPHFDAATMNRLGDFVILTDPGLARSF